MEKMYDIIILYYFIIKKYRKEDLKMSKINKKISLKDVFEKRSDSLEPKSKGSLSTFCENDVRTGKFMLCYC